MLRSRYPQRGLSLSPPLTATAPSSELCVLLAVFMLSCNFPRRPDFGDVTVMDLHSGGVAHFHCHLGYELQGPRVLTCINASRPHWSSPEPICSGTCLISLGAGENRDPQWENEGCFPRAMS